MFEADGYRVAVTVSPVVSALPDDWDPVPAGVVRRRSRLVEVLDPARASDRGLVRELGSIADLRAQLAAYEAGVVAELAARRPAETDLTADRPGHGVDGWVPDGVRAAGVSEFFADELATVMRTSQAAAVGLAERSLALVRELPATWGALADGLVDPARATAIVRALAGQSTSAGGPVDPAVVTAVEAQAIGWAVAGEPPVRLRERTAAALIALDEAAADRRRKRAERCADVTVRAAADGMAQLVTDLSSPVAAACRDAVDGYARLLKADGDVRPIGQLRSLVLADLVLRPWDTSRPPVTAHLTVLAPLPTPGRPAPEAAGRPTDADAATVDGAPITAGQLRDLLAQLQAVCPGGLQAPAGGSLDVALTDPATGALRATVSPRELARLARRGCPGHPAGSCGCAVLDRPAPVDRYVPTPAQRRFIRARDRTCRHPGCRRPAARTDADHVTAHRDGGRTDCANLCCLCRRHHRLKTHAPGWRFTMSGDGTLTVTTPSGVTRTTRPPGTRLPAITGAGSPPDPDDPPPF
ncbi:HNH endonuclease signature motif containing protein [Modestobacter sp. URMC 112]